MVYCIKEVQMSWKILIPVTSITILLTIALIKNIDGVLLSGGIAVIAGLAGWSAHKAKPS